MSQTIYLASDHGGFNLKMAYAEHLRAKGYEVKDLGPDCTDSCDYPLFAQKLCNAILADEGSLGVLACGTGIGMSIAANRVKGIRAALCHNEFTARMAKAHNNANILCVGERVVGTGVALSILDAYLETEFEGDRHKRRIDLIEEL